jgi:high-affinity iron transporter
VLVGNALIGLREGLEAALVVSVLVAFLVRSGRRSVLPTVWLGTGAALLLSVVAGGLVAYAYASLSFEQQEAFGGIASIVAVGFVTWMIFWMARAARGMGGVLREQVDAAQESRWSLALVAMLAVGREGLETALILWSNTQAATRDGATSDTRLSVVAGVLGILSAVALGYLIYRGAITINLTKFFTWTGAFLVLVAAGVLAYGIHDLQEARFLPGLDNLAFDVSDTIDVNSWYGALLKGIFNFSPATTKLEAAAWLLYAVPVMALFLLGVRRRSASTRPVTTTEQPSVPAHH